ncbi:MAG TPA: NAD(P)-binding domain-containing protein [Gemmatimonas sp.]|nr:NAD(P)-binding domain-containing protein [Gemmatimonas sp.]
MTRVAVLGTGLLGSGIAEGLIARGNRELAVWNRSVEKTAPLVALGARTFATAADAVVGVDLIHLVLRDDEAVDAIVTEIRGSIAPRAVIVDHTTTRPDRTAARAAALDAAGIDYLHAPVMMGPAAARTGKGIMLVAGPNERFARVREMLAPMSGELWHVGERPDLAACYKLFGNAAILSMVGTIADVMHMADAMGVLRAGALEMLGKVNLSGTIGMRAPMMIDGNFAPQFTLDVARKDIGLMLESAGAESTPILRALAARMDEVIAAGDAGLDVAVLGK